MPVSCYFALVFRCPVKKVLKIYCIIRFLEILRAFWRASLVKFLACAKLWVSAMVLHSISLLILHNIWDGEELTVRGHLQSLCSLWTGQLLPLTVLWEIRGSTCSVSLHEPFAWHNLRGAPIPPGRGREPWQLSKIFSKSCLHEGGAFSWK